MSAAAGKRTSSKARSGLISSLIELLNKENLIDEEVLAKSDMDKKVEMLTKAIIDVNNKFATVHEIVNEASDGLDPRTTDCEEKIQGLSDENAQLRFELDIIKGSFFKLEKENTHLRNKVVALMALTMKNNITISGLCADEYTENAVDTVHEFLTEKMNLDVPKVQIISAKRIGIPGKPDIPRLMAVQLQPQLKELIMSNLKTLKGKLNDRQRPYSINKQLPDQWTEENKILKDAVAKAHKVNEKKSDEQEKDNIEVKRGKLFINKVEQKLAPLTAPKTEDLFVDKAEQDRMDRIKFHISDTTEENASKFTAFATKLQSLPEVRRAYIKMRQKFPAASHIMAAYVIKANEGFQDDREFGAASRILKILKQQQVNNLAIFVVREHDGKHIGPRRHSIIEKTVLEAIAKYKH